MPSILHDFWIENMQNTINSGWFIWMKIPQWILDDTWNLGQPGMGIFLAVVLGGASTNGWMIHVDPGPRLFGETPDGSEWQSLQKPGATWML